MNSRVKACRLLMAALAATVVVSCGGGGGGGAPADVTLPPAPDTPDTPARFAQRLNNHERLKKQVAVRMAHSDLPGHGMLFVDGAAWPLTADSRNVASQLCRGDPVSARAGSERAGLLYELYCDGKLYWIDGE